MARIVCIREKKKINQDSSGSDQARSQGGAMGAMPPPQFRMLHQKFLG